MRRNARTSHGDKDEAYSQISSIMNTTNSNEDFVHMERLSKPSSGQHNFENTIEAKVEADDTLQAIALRFHCTVADIKRLNKIYEDREVHARKILKIPVTVHNVLLDVLPTVHKSGSGSGSPKLNTKLHNDNDSNGDSRDSISGLSSLVRNPLEDAEAMLSEKLMVASVNASGVAGPSTNTEAATTRHINNIILNSKMNPVSSVYRDEEFANNLNDASAPLITDILDDSTLPQMHRIRGPSLRAIDWSGHDCDMSWVCLFVLILGLCFVIPLIYIIYIAEHAHHNASSSPLHQAAHIIEKH